MGFPESTPANRSNLRLPRWTTIAFYLAILLFVAWLEYSPTGDRAAKNPFPPASPTTQNHRPPADDEGDSKATSDTISGKTPPQSRAARTRPDPESKSEDGDPAPPPEVKQSRPKRPPASPSNDRADRDDALLIRNVTIRDEDRRVVYRGDVNLAPTLKRIENGTRLRFSHDGIVFENRERRLPVRPSGYYREFIQPTPGDNGPGAQRVVLGAGGEVFYTSDHYRTFRRIR
jgi:ribonuclease T1